MQHTAFWEQSLAAIVIYAPSLVAAALLVNLKKDRKYGNKVVLNNEEFNFNLLAILFMGLISIGLCKTYEYFNKHLLADPDSDTDSVCQEHDPPSRGKVVCQVLRGTFLVLALTVAPFFLVNFFTHHDAKMGYSYISLVHDNSTHIIQVKDPYPISISKSVKC